ncbi:MAG: hypothetical protein PUC83_14750 [Fibrobacter sp.]|nr:hypothetical protein [Fibrobacter sp.]MDD5943899.1 hypothetical protein [Fibrobacter sp.]
MSVATKCSHFGMTERSRGRRRRQNLATIKDYTHKIAEALHVFRNPYGSAMKMHASIFAALALYGFAAS